MKKGVKMNWIEEKGNTRMYGYSEKPTNESILPEGTKLFHGSYWKLDGFAPITTCFTPESWAFERGLGITGYTYMAILKKPATVTWYGEDEVRLEISSENVDIYYLGNIKEEKVLYRVTKNKNLYSDIKEKKHCYAKEFKDIAKILNAIENKEAEWRYKQNNYMAAYELVNK